MRRARNTAAVVLAIISVVIASWLFASPHLTDHAHHSPARSNVHDTHHRSSHACRGAAPRPTRHVVWIWFENASYDRIIGAPGSHVARTQPYFNQVARDCASLESMSAIQHASLGNYIGAVTGSPAGIHGGCSPTQCPIDRMSVFDRVTEAGGSWRSYQESMPRPCVGKDAGRYAVRHDPVPYLTRLAADCSSSDLPLGSLETGAFAAALDGATLPSLAMITPDLCDDGHDCAAAHADAWFARWLPRITDSPAYRRGDVVVIVTWDEGDRRRAPGVSVNTPCPRTSLRADCHVATMVVAPSIKPGTTVTQHVDHVDLLHLTQVLLRLGAPLGEDRSPAQPLAHELGLTRVGQRSAG
ncbi:MAG: phosphoesterase [Thermoleophilia bacterium]|nr:phosphoesterase [Thermoleophilia bacterium]